MPRALIVLLVSWAYIFQTVPTTITFEIWKTVAEAILIPLLIYGYNKLFISRGDINSQQLKTIVDLTEKMNVTVTALGEALRLLEYRVNEAVQDHELLSEHFYKHKDEVLRSGALGRRKMDPK
jgi:hypothetical protein